MPAASPGARVDELLVFRISGSCSVRMHDYAERIRCARSGGRGPLHSSFGGVLTGLRPGTRRAGKLRVFQSSSISVRSCRRVRDALSADKPLVESLPCSSPLASFSTKEAIPSCYGERILSLAADPNVKCFGRGWGSPTANYTTGDCARWSVQHDVSARAAKAFIKSLTARLKSCPSTRPLSCKG